MPMTPTKRVMITGASSGIGAACALHLARMGFGVYAGVRKEEDGEGLVRESTGRLTPVLVDITDPNAVANAATRVAHEVKGAGLYGLVNNAGVAVAGPLEAIPLDEVRYQLEVNVIGQLSMIQSFLPLLREARGRIVNMSSISGQMVVPLLGPYAASKFALEAISDALRMELRPWGVEVAIVEPGGVDTPIWRKSVASTHAMIDGFSERTRALYRPLVDAVVAATERSKRFAVPPQRVARVVGRALTARRPRTRYIVGADAVLMIRLLGALPDRLRDWLILRFLNRGA